MTELPEYYSTQELQAMSAEDLRRAQANGFRKDIPSVAGTPVEGATTFPAPSPTPTPPQARPAGQVWGQSQEYDFTCPSGATCRMRRLAPERLIESGMLDRMTRLPGLVQDLVDKSEGKPPTVPVDEVQAMKSVLEMMQEIIPEVVIEPHVYADPKGDEEKVEGRIYVSSIDLADRMAIVNRATLGVSKMDSFR